MKKLIYQPDNDLYKISVAEIYRSLVYGYTNGLTEDGKTIKFVGETNYAREGTIYTDLLIHLRYRVPLDVLSVFSTVSTQDEYNKVEKMFEHLARRYGGYIFEASINENGGDAHVKQLGDYYTRKYQRETCLEYKELTYKLLKGEAL